MGDPVSRTTDEIVSGFQKELQNRLFEIESKFDGAVLLVSGGAFTVSAAFVPRLQDALALPVALAMAWTAWALCLLACIGGHLLSANCHKRKLAAISEKKYSAVWQETFWDRTIHPINLATYGLLFVGFVAFGIFTFANLNFGVTDGESEEERKEESVLQGSLPASSSGGQHSTEPAGGISQGHQKEEVITNGREREASPPAASPGQTSLRERKEVGGLMAKPGSSEQRTGPTARVSQGEPTRK